MAKRKRTEPTDVIQRPREAEAKKVKLQHASATKQKTSENAITKAKPAVREAEKPVTPTAVRIVTGSYEKVLAGVDVKFASNSGDNHKLNLTPVYMFSAHTGAIKCLASSDRYLVSGGSDEVIKIYDLKKRKDLGSLAQHTGAVTALQFYSRNHLLSASEDGTICIWRTRDWECMATMKGHKGRVNGICVHPTGKIAVSVGKDRALRLWNLMTGRKASNTKLGEEAYAVKWNGKGDQYAILFDRKIVIYNMDAEPQATIEHRARIHCIRYFLHPVHGETLLAGTDDKLIRIHSVSDGSLLQELKGHRARVKAIDTTLISHGGDDLQLLVSASSDGEIKSWIMLKDGSVTDKGTYDTGNRLLCLSLHDAAIEQLDSFVPRIKNNDDLDADSEITSDSDNSDEEADGDDEEWDGIREDA